MNHPIYICPHDESALTVGQNTLHCVQCNQRFCVEDGIAVLDVVQSQERFAFDRSARSTRRLGSGQLAGARKKAESFLDVAQIKTLREAVILDLGCGFGELTCGLVSSQYVARSHVYSVDHSIDSLRVLLRSAVPENLNELHLSAQDACALSFPPATFDLVLGSALLHHILDYRSLLKRVHGILKPSGKAVFSEPFSYGYLIPIVLIKIALAELGIDAKRLKKSEFGMCDFIVQDISDRVQHEDDSEFLRQLTDKHLFRRERLAAVCYEAGFKSVTFQRCEDASFYEHWAPDLLFVYGIHNPELASKVDWYYEIFKSVVGVALPDLASHFEYIVLMR
jgi:ubiquinone/menaquinone biosynthesis C-methylase UbiE